MEKMRAEMRNHPNHRHLHGRRSMKAPNMNMAAPTMDPNAPSAAPTDDESKTNAEGLVNEDFFSAEGVSTRQIHWPSVAIGAGIVIALFYLHKKLKIKV